MIPPAVQVFQMRLGYVSLNYYFHNSGNSDKLGSLRFRLGFDISPDLILG